MARRGVPLPFANDLSTISGFCPGFVASWRLGSASWLPLRPRWQQGRSCHDASASSPSDDFLRQTSVAAGSGTRTLRRYRHDLGMEVRNDRYSVVRSGGGVRGEGADAAQLRRRRSSLSPPRSHGAPQPGGRRLGRCPSPNCSVWRFGGLESCPNTGFHCSSVAKADGELTVLAVDAGRIAVRTEASVRLITACGELLRSFPSRRGRLRSLATGSLSARPRPLRCTTPTPASSSTASRPPIASGSRPRPRHPCHRFEWDSHASEARRGPKDHSPPGRGSLCAARAAWPLRRRRPPPDLHADARRPAPARRLAALTKGAIESRRRSAPGGGTSTSHGHPRTIFRRALEHDNLMLAEVTAREIGRNAPIALLHAHDPHGGFPAEGPIAKRAMP